MRTHTSKSLRTHKYVELLVLVPYYRSPCSAYVSIRQHTSAYAADEGEVAHIYVWSCCYSYPVVSSAHAWRTRNNPYYVTVCVVILLYMWPHTAMHVSSYPIISSARASRIRNTPSLTLFITANAHIVFVNSCTFMCAAVTHSSVFVLLYV